jgi:DNA-binding response OmpR family regulator
MGVVFLLDDDEMWGGCVERVLYGYEVLRFGDGVEAMDATLRIVPDLMILDIMLDGPNGLVVLHEMQSYEDLMRVPVIIVSNVDFLGADLREYGVVAVFDKGKMRPEELRAAAERAIGVGITGVESGQGVAE